MRTYHTHFGIPLGIAPGWWDDRKRNHMPVLPIYLRLDISSNLSRALSCLRLSGHNFLDQIMRQNKDRRPYELRICDKCLFGLVSGLEKACFFQASAQNPPRGIYSNVTLPKMEPFVLF